MEELVSLCKRRGFVYPSSEIYGGLANAYDYGPLGAELLRNIRNIWWQEFISKRGDMVGLDSQIIVHPQTWVASGHVSAFNEPLIEDLKTNKRYRADHLIEWWLQSPHNKEKLDIIVEELTRDEMDEFIKKHAVKSPEGNQLSEIKKFDLLFKSHLGVVEGNKDKVYLRGETAQGIFINFKNIIDSTRVSLPFGIGQIGKSFRNEITTGQFIFRTFEFEQAEIEYFFNPDKTDWNDLFKSWQDSMWNFVTNVLGVQEDHLRWRRHTDKERSHYSKDTYDLDYNFPFGWKELWGVAYRTDYDLKQHMQFSGKSMEYTDSSTGKSFIPHVIEPAVGINRLFFMVLWDAYRNDNGRIYLRLKPSIAPYKVAVFPLVANKEELVGKAREIYLALKQNFSVYWDDRGNIGKRYRYQDEVGTPYCITVDYETLETETVTLRDRDSMEQERVSIKNLEQYLRGLLKI